MLSNGERQVAPKLSGIRRDHRARYEWAAKQLAPGSRVIDLACGVGYGAFILAEAGHQVLALDRDQEAIAYAREHYKHPRILFTLGDAAAGALNLAPAGFDAAVSFETIEHLADPLPMLRALRAAAPTLLASVPNQTFFPFRGYRFHYRHYTESQFEALLAEAGYEVTAVRGQVGPKSAVGKRPGRTLVVAARRREETAAVLPPRPADTVAVIASPAVRTTAAGPESVAILGLGLTLKTFIDMAKGLGSRKKVCDEVWGINALGDLIQCDRVFALDDVRIQEIRAAADPAGNIAAMLPWMKTHPGPIYTSQPHPDYPGTVKYPLADVLNSCRGQRYLNTTAACAVAFAIHLGVKKIMCFGMDFTLPNSHRAEQGRACVEFWLGFACARGIDLSVPKGSSLLDAAVPNNERIYGYDAVDLAISGPPGRERVRMKPRKHLPTAEEMERRYDHDRHPNPLMRG